MVGVRVLDEAPKLIAIKGLDQRFRGMKRLLSGRMFDLVGRRLRALPPAHPVDSTAGRDVAARSPLRRRSVLLESKDPAIPQQPGRFLQRCRPVLPLFRKRDQ
jgi:hypothetical protein